MVTSNRISDLVRAINLNVHPVRSPVEMVQESISQISPTVPSSSFEHHRAFSEIEDAHCCTKNKLECRLFISFARSLSFSFINILRYSIDFSCIDQCLPPPSHKIIRSRDSKLIQ